MSGLIALLDDVAAISKVAAASIDDVAGQAARAGVKTAGALIDDAAVTPKYLHGFDAEREIPMVWKISKGSIFNKIVILLPIALLLTSFAPWLISPLLMLGGSYLCFEGAEKIWHIISPSAEHASQAHIHPEERGAALEEKRVSGAIKTDFILSAEIMTIALSTIPVEDSIIMKAVILLIVAIGVTAAVYGSVALIVKADDFGLHLVKNHDGFLARIGTGIVKMMPHLMTTLTVVGTAAMLWVGGNIVLHGLHEMGFHLPSDWIRDRALMVAALAPAAPGFVAWFVTAFFDGIFGLILGLILIPLTKYVLAPISNVTLVPLTSWAKSIFGQAKGT